MRSDLPAMEVCTTSRNVEPTRVGVMCQGSPSKGEAAHVPTQGAGAGLGAVDWAEAAATVVSNAIARWKRILVEDLPGLVNESPS